MHRHREVLYFGKNVDMESRLDERTWVGSVRLSILHKTTNGKYRYSGVLRAKCCISPCYYSENFLGVPFNISSYALLTHLVAHVCGLKMGELIYTLGDYHIYQNHKEQVQELLSREPKPLPRLEIKDEENRLRGLEGLLSFRSEHLNLIGYESHAKIAAEVAV